MNKLKEAMYTETEKWKCARLRQNYGRNDKYIEQIGKEIMLKIYIRIWREEEIANDWKKSLIFLVYKDKENKKECNNYIRI